MVYPVYIFFRFLSWLILVGWCGYRVEGREHIPRRGAFLIAANHRSYLDPPAVGVAFRRHVHFIAKDELFRLPFLGPVIRRLGAISVVLSQPLAVNTRLLKTAIRYLQQGNLVAIFPEGRRNVSGDLEPAKLGVAMIAMKAGVPILPVAVLGTEKALPADARALRRWRVTVRIGAPIPVDPALARAGRSGYERLGRQVTAAITNLLPSEQLTGS